MTKFNGSNHWTLRQPDQVSKTGTMSRGMGVLFAVTCEPLSSHPTKDGRATDSCFFLIEAHYCSVLMVDANQGETAVCGSFILFWMTWEAVTGCQK